ncbi:hypothetical protein TNCV_103001 [Trichonephila clavipes]|nr:hypothetical protein TNCV_103001 [Trichonephila clavipes]
MEISTGGGKTGNLQSELLSEIDKLTVGFIFTLRKPSGNASRFHATGRLGFKSRAASVITLRLSGIVDNGSQNYGQVTRFSSEMNVVNGLGVKDVRYFGGCTVSIPRPRIGTVEKLNLDTCGRGSLVWSWSTLRRCQVAGSCSGAIEDRGHGSLVIKLTRPPVGVVLKLGEVVPAQVSPTSLDHGSKGPAPSPKALV